MGNGESIGWQFLFGSAWAVGAKLLGVTAALAVNAMLARLLSPSDYGAYLLAAGVVSIGSVVAALGTGNAAIRLLGLSQARPDGADTRIILWRCAIIAVAGASLTSLLVAGPVGHWLAGAVFDSPALQAGTAWVAVWLFAVTLQSVLAEMHRGLKDIRLAALLGGPTAAACLAGALGSILLVDVGITVSGSLALTAIATFVVIPVSVVALSKKVPRNGAAHAYGYGRISAMAAPMLLTSLALAVLVHADIWIAGAMLDDTDVAVYGAAWQMASLVALPLYVVNSVIPAHIAELHELRAGRELERAIRRATGIAAYCALVGFVLVAMLSELLLGTVYGDYYVKARFALVALAAGRLFNVVSGPCGLVLLMTGSERLMSRTNLITLALGIIIMTLGARFGGIAGLAMSAAAVMVAQNLVMLILAHVKAGIWTFAELRARALLAA